MDELKLHRRVQDFSGRPILFLHSSTLDTDVDYVRQAGLAGVSCHADDLALLPLEEFEALSVQPDADSDLSELRRCSRLKALAVGRVHHVAVDLSGFEELEVLRLAWHPKTVLPAEFRRLRQLELRKFSPKSRRFDVAAPNLVGVSIIEGSIASLAGMEACQRVRSVKLAYLTKLADAGALSELVGLKDVEFDHCKKVESYSFLEHCPELERLSLLDSGTVESLAFARRMPNLRHLVFAGTVVADGDMTPLLGKRFDYLYFDDKRSYSHSLAEVKASADNSG